MMITVERFLAGLGVALLASLTLTTTSLAAPQAKSEAEIETAFDTQIDPAEMSQWMKQMSSAPNHVGAPHDKENAEFMLGLFKAWGWDARLEEFDVLYPTPIAESVELLGPNGFQATLQEPAVPGDSTSQDLTGALPAYLTYQGDGDVTADLVYVNYGMPDDYAELARHGIDVRGKIVIARYGAGLRGLKPKLAQQHGAVGCIIYSDPKDDGYWSGDVYPKGGMRPPFGIQRGSVIDLMADVGDPLTPGVPATKSAHRIPRDQATTILKIPAIPISYGDAQRLLAALEGPVAPAEFRGALPITYHIGPGPAKVQLVVKSDWGLKPLYDVVAVMRGSELPDEWVMRGNHHDAWVFGASDPLSGAVPMMEEAKAIGGLVKAGWRPKRTIVDVSWDGEEPSVLGSAEWAEAHADELRQKALVYVNSDLSGRGVLWTTGSHSWQHFANDVGRCVVDPESGVSVTDRLRAKLEIDGQAAGATSRAKELARVAESGADLPNETIGAGSDFMAFIDHLGVASFDLHFGGEEAESGVYHSAYDSFDHYVRFDDPGFVYAKVLAETAGHFVLRAADADAPVQRFSDFADAVAGYRSELSSLMRTEQDKSVLGRKLAEARAYEVAADPRAPVRGPTIDAGGARA